MDVDVQPRVCARARQGAHAVPHSPGGSFAGRVHGAAVEGHRVARGAYAQGEDAGKGLEDAGLGLLRRDEETRGRPARAVSAANPGWAASGTGSEDLDARRRRVTAASGRRFEPIGRDLVRDLGGVSLSRGAVTDTDRAVGGAIDMRERVAPPSGPAAAAKQHAVYGDDSDDEPPPL